MEPRLGIEPKHLLYRSSRLPLHQRGTSKNKLERVKRIELSSQAWEVHVLPLNHTRIFDTYCRIKTHYDIGGHFCFWRQTDSTKIGAPCRDRTDLSTLEGSYTATMSMVQNYLRKWLPWDGCLPPNPSSKLNIGL